MSEKKCHILQIEVVADADLEPEQVADIYRSGAAMIVVGGPLGRAIRVISAIPVGIREDT